MREYLPLDSLWKVLPDPENRGLNAGWLDGNEIKRMGNWCAVPGAWQQRFHDFYGVAWYLTEFELDEPEKIQRLWVRFAAAHYHTTCWLNEQVLGEHTGGHTPFDFEFTGMACEGTNKLVLRIVSPGESACDGMTRDTIATGRAALAQGFSGLWQEPEVILTPRNTLKEVLPSYSSKTGELLLGLTIDAQVSAGCTLAVRAELLYDFDPDSDLDTNVPLNIAKGVNEYQVTIPWEHALTWSPAQPNQYRLSTQLISDNEETDQFILQTGFPDFSPSGDNLTQKTVFAVAYSPHYPVACYRPLEGDRDRQQLLELKAIGLNTLVLVDGPVNKAVYIHCSDLGIRVISMPALSSVRSDIPLPNETLLLELERTIRRDSPFACVCAYVISVEHLSEALCDKLRELAAKLDSQRPLYILPQDSDKLSTISSHIAAPGDPVRAIEHLEELYEGMEIPDIVHLKHQLKALESGFSRYGADLVFATPSHLCHDAMAARLDELTHNIGHHRATNPDAACYLEAFQDTAYAPGAGLYDITGKGKQGIEKLREYLDPVLAYADLKNYYQRQSQPVDYHVKVINSQTEKTDCLLFVRLSKPGERPTCEHTVPLTLANGVQQIEPPALIPQHAGDHQIDCEIVDSDGASLCRLHRRFRVIEECTDELPPVCLATANETLEAWLKQAGIQVKSPATKAPGTVLIHHGNNVTEWNQSVSDSPLPSLYLYSGSIDSRAEAPLCFYTCHDILEGLPENQIAGEEASSLFYEAPSFILPEGMRSLVSRFDTQALVWSSHFAIAANDRARCAILAANWTKQNASNLYLIKLLKNILLRYTP